jgi:hypothetical protein
MLGTLTRGAYMLIVAVMIAAYALSAAKSDEPEPAKTQPTYTLYS